MRKSPKPYATAILVIFFTLMVLALAACAPDPQPVLTPLEVDTPIAMTCKIAPVIVPKWNSDTIRSTDSYLDKLKAALADLKLRIAYESQLLAAQSKCQ